ncbi:MAG: hypothetical protein KGL75_01770 [Acidobacteriota bacterium]|nr:hypothetical protein [Acidobacteriota bacterium]
MLWFGIWGSAVRRRLWHPADMGKKQRLDPNQLASNLIKEIIQEPGG